MFEKQLVLFSWSDLRLISELSQRKEQVFSSGAFNLVVSPPIPIRSPDVTNQKPNLRRTLWDFFNKMFHFKKEKSHDYEC